MAATGGTGNIQGGSRTFFNEDGTKTIIKTDGSVLKEDGNGKIIDTGKKAWSISAVRNVVNRYEGAIA